MKFSSKLSGGFTTERMFSTKLFCKYVFGLQEITGSSVLVCNFLKYFGYCC